MFLSGSGEKGMNGSDSLSNHENLTLFEGLPPQGLSEARRTGSFFGRQSAAGATRRGRWHSSHQRKRVLTIPASNLNTMIFTGNTPSRAKRSTGVSLPPLWLPRCDNSWTGNMFSSLSAGAVWGTGTVPSFIEPVLCSSYHSKTNSPEPFYQVLITERIAFVILCGDT